MNKFPALLMSGTENLRKLARLKVSAGVPLPSVKLVIGSEVVALAAVTLKVPPVVLVYAIETFAVVFKAIVPLLMVVPPVYEFVAFQVNVPVPDLTRPSFAPAPLVCRGPVNVEVLL